MPDDAVLAHLWDASGFVVIAGGLVWFTTRATVRDLVAEASCLAVPHAVDLDDDGRAWIAARVEAATRYAVPLAVTVAVLLGLVLPLLPEVVQMTSGALSALLVGTVVWVVTGALLTASLGRASGARRGAVGRARTVADVVDAHARRSILVADCVVATTLVVAVGYGLASGPYAVPIVVTAACGALVHAALAALPHLLLRRPLRVDTVGLVPRGYVLTMAVGLALHVRSGTPMLMLVGVALVVQHQLDPRSTVLIFPVLAVLVAVDRLKHHVTRDLDPDPWIFVREPAGAAR